MWGDLAEVYALAVSPKARGKGVGKQLVQACIDKSATLGIKRVMALTYEQQFFEKLGFTVMDRQQLPLKVWSECVRCSKNNACDEIAMVYVNDDVVAPAAPKPIDPPTGSYEVPVILNVRRPSPEDGGPRPKMDEAPKI